MSNELIIEQFFPIHVGYANNPFHDELEKQLIDHCLNLKNTVKKGGHGWISDSTYNTCGTYNILEDKKFERLNNWVHENVESFADSLNFRIKPKCSEGWFNIYKKYDYQEYHCHKPYIISCTYFLKSNMDKPSKIFFKNDRELLSYSRNLQSDVWHKPEPGKLVIFGSYVEHAVEQNKSDDLRIALAYNYGG